MCVLTSTRLPAGDRTANLMWRLMDGELPKTNMPKMVALLIGVHDLANVLQASPGCVGLHSVLVAAMPLNRHQRLVAWEPVPASIAPFSKMFFSFPCICRPMPPRQRSWQRLIRLCKGGVAVHGG